MLIVDDEKKIQPKKWKCVSSFFDVRSSMAIGLSHANNVWLKYK